MAMRPLTPGTSPPWIIAHRGASADWPENTHAAFVAALALPIAGIELDVQLSRDGVPVVYHHRTLFRAGRRGRHVHDLDLEELRHLDVGNGPPGRRRDAAMPTLDEVLERYGAKTHLLLEIKARRGIDTEERHRELTAKVVAAVQRRALAAVYILSFNPTVLAEVQHLTPELPCVRNLDAPIPLSRRDAPRSGTFAAVCVDVRRLTPEFTTQSHHRGLPLLTYTCNSPRTVRRAMAAGADALISDRPAWLHAYLAAHREKQ